MCAAVHGGRPACECLVGPHTGIGATDSWQCDGLRIGEL